MNTILTIIMLASGLLTVFLILSSGADDQGLLSNNTSGRFIPGSLDSAKNKIILFFALIFFCCTVAMIIIKTKSNKIKKINTSSISESVTTENIESNEDNFEVPS